jgi:hypothetical protein
LRTIKLSQLLNFLTPQDGSSIENWHCILRQGLKNASGTKLQVNGAAYGNGIYLSPHFGTSLGYCKIMGVAKPLVSWGELGGFGEYFANSNF